MAAKYPVHSPLCSVPLVAAAIGFVALAACGNSSDPVEQQPPPSNDVPLCADLNVPVNAFSSSGIGQQRGDVAEDFTLTLVDGTTWNFKENFSGCDTYVFVPDGVAVSESKRTSVWAADVDSLIEASPQNVHYFFVSTASSAS